MPELPEVELVARFLDQLVTGRRIIKVAVNHPKLLLPKTPQAFQRSLRGATFADTTRRGKFIVTRFDKPYILLTHLRMTGRFLYLAPDDIAPKHTHVIFYLDNDFRLAFSDPRRFGIMRLYAEREFATAKELTVLAHEPFAPEFTAAALYETLQRTRRPVKEVLLDQARVVGLGNIYAAEALHLAGINPLRPAAEISRLRAARLRDAIVEILNTSIAHGSTMNVDPRNIDGSYYGGGYERHWFVYERENEPCARCQTKIRRIVQAQRSTYFCPRCQRS